MAVFKPNDPQLVENILAEVKRSGLFDQFRKDCISDVDTKPAYQNLKFKVENTVTNFLNKQKWTPETNRNQLRERLRKNALDASYLDSGIQRIVDQVLHPKMPNFKSQVEELFYSYLKIDRPKRLVKEEKNEIDGGSKPDPSLLPRDLEAVSSPESDKTKTEESDVLNKTYDDDDFESPAFELLEGIKKEGSPDSHLSGISGLTSHTSDDKKLEIKGESPTMDNADTQLSVVSSTSRLSIIMQSEKDSDSPKPVLNIAEEAQMPEFNENSDSVGVKGSSSEIRRMEISTTSTSTITKTTVFDFKKEEIAFKGTNRRQSLSLTLDEKLKEEIFESENKHANMFKVEDFEVNSQSTSDIKLEIDENAPTVASTKDDVFELNEAVTTVKKEKKTDSTNTSLVEISQMTPDIKLELPVLKEELKIKEEENDKKGSDIDRRSHHKSSKYSSSSKQSSRDNDNERRRHSSSHKSSKDSKGRHSESKDRHKSRCDLQKDKYRNEKSKESDSSKERDRKEKSRHISSKDLSKDRSVSSKDRTDSHKKDRRDESRSHSTTSSSKDKDKYRIRDKKHSSDEKKSRDEKRERSDKNVKDLKPLKSTPSSDSIKSETMAIGDFKALEHTVMELDKIESGPSDEIILENTAVVDRINPTEEYTEQQVSLDETGIAPAQSVVEESKLKALLEGKDKYEEKIKTIQTLADDLESLSEDELPEAKESQIQEKIEQILPELPLVKVQQLPSPSLPSLPELENSPQVKTRSVSPLPGPSRPASLPPLLQKHDNSDSSSSSFPNISTNFIESEESDEEEFLGFTAEEIEASQTFSLDMSEKQLTSTPTRLVVPSLHAEQSPFRTAQANSDQSETPNSTQVRSVESHESTKFNKSLLEEDSFLGFDESLNEENRTVLKPQLGITALEINDLSTKSEEMTKNTTVIKTEDTSIEKVAQDLTPSEPLEVKSANENGKRNRKANTRYSGTDFELSIDDNSLFRNEKLSSSSLNKRKRSDKNEISKKHKRSKSTDSKPSDSRTIIDSSQSDGKELHSNVTHSQLLKDSSIEEDDLPKTKQLTSNASIKTINKQKRPSNSESIVSDESKSSSSSIVSKSSRRQR